MNIQTAADLETELRELERKCSESDQPENAKKRTKEELATRYEWSDRIREIRKELGKLFAQSASKQ